MAIGVRQADGHAVANLHKEISENPGFERLFRKASDTIGDETKAVELIAQAETFEDRVKTARSIIRDCGLFDSI